MKRVNFLLRLCFLALISAVFLSPAPSEARNYVPARKIGVKREYKRNKLPPGMVRRSDRRMTKTVYRKKPSKHFQKKLVGPYIAAGLGVQMHRHDGTATDGNSQEHQFDANDQGFNLDIALGWSFLFNQGFFLAPELGLTAIPLTTSMSISDGSTRVKVKGVQGFNLSLLGGKHFNNSTAIAYLRLGLELRKFEVKHDVQDGVDDDIDDNKMVFGWSPGLGIGFLLCDWVYMIAEFRTVFYQKISFTSPRGRLNFNDTRPRVDIFLLKFVLPLNQCFGTSFGMCRS